jgi:hypothetical protein
MDEFHGATAFARGYKGIIGSIFIAKANSANRKPLRAHAFLSLQLFL